MGRLRILIPAILSTALGIVCVQAALAQSDICTRLEARLMALESRGNIDQSQALDKSIRQHREDLRQAEAEARRAGCAGSFFRRLTAQGACGRLMAAVDRARARLNRLTATRGSSRDDSFGPEHRELVRALAANNCGPHYQDYDQPARRGGLLATLFGRPLFRERHDGLFGNGYGTFRTLCVRTCDGYYFPISFTTVQSRFSRDEQVCRSMCPGTEVALYVHRNPGEESTAMMSLAGEPYVALPTAFRYRSEYDPTCRCGKMTVPVAETAGEPVGFTPAYDDPWRFARSADVMEQFGGDPPFPLSRPAAGEDPETLENRSGDLTPKVVEPPVSAIARLSADGKRHVRIVGPSYFYAQ